MQQICSRQQNHNCKSVRCLCVLFERKQTTLLGRKVHICITIKYCEARRIVQILHRK